MDQRKGILKEIVNFYNVRNKIVHGSNKNKEKYLKNINIDSIENHIRNAIKIFVARSNEKKLNHDQIIELLDLG